MSRSLLRAVGSATAALAASLPAWAAAAPPADHTTKSAPPQSAADNAIFDPQRAPVIVLRLGVHRLVLVPRPNASQTTLGAQAIESKANSSSLANIIAASVPGAAASSSGELHIRGSHGQYTYYLDGAPLPASVSGSFGDLIDPKNIQTLRVLTGGFPAQYGGNIAAVFDVTAKAGQPGRPRGFFQQIGQGYGTYQSTGQAGGGADNVSYFVSGVRRSTDRRLDPVTQDPLHDAGMESVVFLKINDRLSTRDQLVFDGARTDAQFQIPNEQDRQAVGQADVQRENGGFANLIWRRSGGANNLTLALYSHQSRLRFDPSAGDLLPSPGETDTSGLISTSEDRTANTVGLRADYTVHAGTRHKIGLGVDVNRVSGQEDFLILSGNGDPPVRDRHAIAGGDSGVYVQDDWAPGRLGVNYGLRYDAHQAEQTASQFSPRLNLTYAAGGHDNFHAYYNRLFQPAAIEDVRRLSGSTAIGDTVITGIKPERNDFYEVGWQHAQSGVTTNLNAYYKTARDVIDEQPLGSTQITVPFNVERGYVRGVELAVEGPVTRNLSFYANYARAWAESAGAISGGIASTDPPSGYFPVDHDQRHTASVGLDYARSGAVASLDGEYGSGFPYQDDNGVFQRVHPHFILNFALGAQIGRGQLTLTVGNLVNHPYVIKQAGTFTNREWGQARTYGIKWTQNF